MIYSNIAMLHLYYYFHVQFRLNIENAEKLNFSLC